MERVYNYEFGRVKHAIFALSFIPSIGEPQRIQIDKDGRKERKE